MTRCCVQRETGTKSFLRIIFLFFIFATFYFYSPLMVCSVPAANVTLEWDANSEPDIAGYKVYYGLKSRNYMTIIDIGNFTTCVVSDLDSGQTYFFAATAYNTDGYESDYSNEVSYSGYTGTFENKPTSDNSGSDQTVGTDVIVTTDSSVATAYNIDGYEDDYSNDVSYTETSENKPPIANAGSDQIVAEGTIISLNGSSSTDPDDGIASYRWVQTGGTTVILSGSTTATPSFRAPVVGSGNLDLTFQLTVTDTNGLQSTDSCIVNVTWQNDEPDANAGPDQTVGEHVTVALNGLGSTDPDDGIASYRWVQTGGTTVTLSGSTTATPTFMAPSLISGGAALTFQLTVTDTGGLQSTDSCIVNITLKNDSSVFNVDPDQPGEDNVSETVIDSKSNDSDNRIVSYDYSR